MANRGSLNWRLRVIIAFALITVAPVHAENDATALVRDTWARYRSVKTERENLDMLLVKNPPPQPFSRAAAEAMLREPPAGTIHKRAVREVLYASDWQDKVHILFSLPAEDAGLGFLTWRHADAQDEMWLFMPGYDTVRRLPLTNRQKLAGTNLSYEDVRELAGERTEQFTYKTVATEPIDGRATTVIVATPRAGTNTAYASRKLWIDTERLFPLKVEFYDAKEQLWKVLSNSDVQPVAPDVYRATITEMRDLRLNESTVTLIAKREVGLDIPARVFTQDYLEHHRAD
jgi:hypothetical protein